MRQLAKTWPGPNTGSNVRRAKGPCLLQVKVLPGNCRYVPVATEAARRVTESLKLSEHRPTMGGSALCARMSETVPTPEITDEGETG